MYLNKLEKRERLFGVLFALAIVLAAFGFARLAVYAIEVQQYMQQLQRERLEDPNCAWCQKAIQDVGRQCSPRNR